MTDQSTLVAVLSTARVKFISTLIVIALVLGIAAECMSLVTAYYNMRKAGAESEAANFPSVLPSLLRDHP